MGLSISRSPLPIAPSHPSHPTLLKPASLLLAVWTPMQGTREELASFRAQSLFLNPDLNLSDDASKRLRFCTTLKGFLEKRLGISDVESKICVELGNDAASDAILMSGVASDATVDYNRIFNVALRAAAIAQRGVSPSPLAFANVAFCELEPIGPFGDKTIIDFSTRLTEAPVVLSERTFSFISTTNLVVAESLYHKISPRESIEESCNSIIDNFRRNGGSTEQLLILRQALLFWIGTGNNVSMSIFVEIYNASSLWMQSFPLSLTSPLPNLLRCGSREFCLLKCEALVPVLSCRRDGLPSQTMLMSDIAYYNVLFDVLKDEVVNLVTPEGFSSWMVGELRLPWPAVSKVWRLVDLDGDGFLDRPEFSMAKHLLLRFMEGFPVPEHLPASLVPPTKRVLAHKRDASSRRVHTVFISYRWSEHSQTFARVVKQALLDLRYEDVFLDVDNLRDGDIRELVPREIRRCDAFIALVTPDCYNRCTQPGDIVRIELTEALAAGKVIVPVFHPEYFRSADYLRPSTWKAGDADTKTRIKALEEPALANLMTRILTRKGVTQNHEFYDAWTGQLHALLQGWDLRSF